MEQLKSKIIGKRFSSRKNKVFKISYEGNICVAKVFNRSWVERARTEFEILEICQNKGVLAPTPIKLLDDAIIMSYISGDNLLDTFNIIERKDGVSNHEINISYLLNLKAKWLAEFHRATDYEIIRGDTIMRNFIVAGDRLFGIDFEESISSDPLIDIGQACAFILSLDPVFTNKRFEAARFFSEKYWFYTRSDRSDELPPLISSALRDIARFRDEPDILKSWADKIEDFKRL